MMASSTTSPMAIASPPSVMVLERNAESIHHIIAVSNDNGMAVSEMKAVRKCPRNKITSATSTPLITARNGCASARLR